MENSVSDDQLDSLISAYDSETSVAFENLDMLMHYAKDMSSTGLVNRHMAIALESLCPDTIDTNKYPINSFTNDLTQTNYQPAMEGILDSIGKLFKAIWDAFVKFIKGIFQFFQGLFRGAKSVQREIDGLEEDLIKANKAELLLLEHLPESMAEAEKQEIRKFLRVPSDDIVEPHLKQLQCRLLYEIGHHTPLTIAFSEFALYYKEFINIANSRIKAVTNFAKEIPNLNVTTEPVFVERINQNLEHVKVRGNLSHLFEKVERLDSVYAAEGKPICDVDALALDVKNIAKQIVGYRYEATPTDVPYSILKHSMLADFKVAKFNIIANDEKEIEHFNDALQKAYNSQMHFDVDGKDSEGLRQVKQTYQSLCIVSRREIVACMDYFRGAYTLLKLRRDFLAVEVFTSKDRQDAIKRKIKKAQ